MEKKKVNLNEIIGETVSALQLEAQKRNLEINFVDDGVQAEVMGDAVRLRQVVTNLLVNAIKFSFNKGEIIVKVQEVGPNIQVSVQDNGIGMTNFQLGNLFQRFYQADDTTTRKYGGLGLGLSICKHLVEMHSGHINIYSKGENMGTTAVFSVPMLEKDTQARDEALGDRAQATKQDDHLQGLRVLVVDDEPDSLALMEAVLKRAGAKVEKAASVQEAVSLGRLFQFDALVSDLSMPEEDGFSLMRKIRAGHTALEKAIPAFAVTAFNDSANMSKAISAGFNHLFGKPFSPPQLIKTLERYFHHPMNNPSVSL